MLENGFISLHRSLLNWEWYDDVNTKILFIHLLLTVNYEKKVWHGITIDRGQRICSIATLADELHISNKAIRTALNHLKQTGEVASTGTNKYSLVTVVKYNDYQDKDRLKGKQKGEQDANEGQAKGEQNANEGQQRNKANNENKANNLINTMFAEFWQSYPKKTAKAQAEKSFAKINPDRELLNTILKAVEEQKRSKQWLKDEGQYIPMPATWLNQRRWEDVVQIDTKPQLTPQQEEDMRAIFG